MSEIQTPNPPTSSHRSQRWLIGVACLMFVLLLGGYFYVNCPSQLQPNVEKAGGTYNEHHIKLSAGQFFSNFLNRAARRDPLHVINFIKQPVDDSWLKNHRSNLADATYLSLTLFGAEVTDVGIKELRGMQNMSTLSLSGKQITDASLTEILTMSNVVSVNLGNTSITGTGLSQLSAMQNLASIEIDGKQAANGGMVSLQSFKRLQTLNISNATNESIAAVAASPKKESYFLWMKGEQITDESLNDLSSLIDLKYLTLVDSLLTEDAVAKLKSALPECEVRIHTTAELKELMSHFDESGEPL